LIGVLEFDEEKVKERILEESNVTPYLAEIMAKNLMKNLPSQLMPLLEKWVVDKKHPNFEFQGITLGEIIVRERYSYCDALVRMAVLIEDPTLVADYIRDRKK